jgi:hypothetical protein
VPLCVPHMRSSRAFMPGQRIFHFENGGPGIRFLFRPHRGVSGDQPIRPPTSPTNRDSVRACPHWQRTRPPPIYSAQFRPNKSNDNCAFENGLRSLGSSANRPFVRHTKLDTKLPRKRNSKLFFERKLVFMKFVSFKFLFLAQFVVWAPGFGLRNSKRNSDVGF